MKNIGLFMVILFSVPLLSSFDKGNLINQPIPVLPGKTLNGKVVDGNYFKGHITLVSFMYIGCVPCMREINLLNRIYNDYDSNKQVRILCIARQMPWQMVQFNSDDTTLFSNIRKAFKVPRMNYDIQAVCDGEVTKMEAFNDIVNLKSECSTIEDIYEVSGYPTTLYIDKNGIVRSISKGGPRSDTDSVFYDGMKREIDALLQD